jgi:putative SOS response-associated peptidase YedK
VCGRTTSTFRTDTLARLLDIDEVDAPELPISWNVAPTQPIYAVATSSNGARKLRALRWGLLPSWARDPRIGARLINARSETLVQRPAFRSLVGTRRALLPVSGFYEWRRPEPGSPAPKQPFYFHRADGEPLVFAGLWDLWKVAPATLVLSHQERSRALARRQRSNRPQGTVLLPGPMEVMKSDDYIRPSGLGRLAFKG